MTGIGRFLYNYLRTVRDVDPVNRYLLLFNTPVQTNLIGDNIRGHVIPETSTPLWDQFKLPRFLKSVGADLFISPYYKLPLFAPCPCINTVHDVHFFTLPLYRKRNGFFLNSYYRLAGRLFCRKASIVMTVSESSKRDIVEAYGVRPEKISVVFNGVDPERFQPMPEADIAEAMKKRFPRLAGDFLLYVGNAKPHKNIDFLLRGYALLPPEVRARTRLVLAGVGDDPLGTEQTDSSPGRVVILPAVSDADLPLLYNAATLFVTASLYEGFCLPVAEAMACGTPVLASDRGALPEIVGEAGYLFNPSVPDDFTKKLKSLLSDKALRDGISAKGLSRVSRFSNPNFSQKIHSIINIVK